jgi:2-methylisocitrate lyase-like PEP mutase family enzyme
MNPKSSELRRLLKAGEFLYLPSAATPIEGMITEAAGCKAAYTGGYASGASSAISEPLLTMTEQIRIARDVANAIQIPLIADAGAGFGEPLHTTRTVREFVKAGIAGIHIEDQVFPKRAHYHRYQVEVIPTDEFVDKIGWACQQRDAVDKDFVIIARSDACRALGLDEAIGRINVAASVGADLGLMFPRSYEDAVEAPRRSKLPLVYVQSRGNRDGRPIYSNSELEAMGYCANIDAQILIGVGVHFWQQALREIVETGKYTGIAESSFLKLRKNIEDLIGLEEHYDIEQRTVQKDGRPA